MKEVEALRALAEGFIDGGVEVVTNFPGFQSHKLFSLVGGEVTSVNEKIAYEIAWGASYVGKRAIVTIKNVGLNDAADPFLNSMLTGVNGGLVVVVFDDVWIEGSQSRQDSRHYFDFFGGLWLEPYSIESAYRLAYKSFEWSERFAIPVVIRITNQLLYLKGSYRRLSPQKGHKTMVKDQAQFVIHPIHSRYQRKRLKYKNREIAKFVNSLYENSDLQIKGKGSKAIVIFGCCANGKIAYLDSEFSKFQLFTYPLPLDKLKEFMNRYSKVYVLEQGDQFGLRKIRELIGVPRAIISKKGLSPRGLKNRYIISDSYRKLFKAIVRTAPDVVVGDLGEYTKDTLKTIDACLCLGSSISVGLGAVLGGARLVFSVIGDGAYLHSGKNVIPEVLRRKAKLNVIVICNGGTRVTGGQKIPGDLFYQTKGIKVFKANYAKISEDKLAKILDNMSKREGLSILYLIM